MRPGIRPPDWLSTFLPSFLQPQHIPPPKLILKTKQNPQSFATDKMKGPGSYQVSEW